MTDPVEPGPFCPHQSLEEIVHYCYMTLAQTYKALAARENEMFKQELTKAFLPTLRVSEDYTIPIVLTLSSTESLVRRLETFITDDEDLQEVKNLFCDFDKHLPIVKFLMLCLRTIFKNSENRQRLQQENLTEVICLRLGDVKNHFKMDKPDMNKLLKDCVIHQEIILLLYNYSMSYILPVGGAKVYGLIYWNEIPDENGGDGTRLSQSAEEKNKVWKWMEKHSIILSNRGNLNFDGNKLLEKIRKDLSKIKEEQCSAVVMFFLAHGAEGYITGGDDIRVALCEIDMEVQQSMYKKIPKVVIVHSCRKEEFGRYSIVQQPSDDAMKSQNFIRVMACAKGEVTRVNIMIPTLLKHWSDGEEFISAVRAAGREHGDETNILRTIMTIESDSLHRELRF